MCVLVVIPALRVDFFVVFASKNQQWLSLRGSKQKFQDQTSAMGDKSDVKEVIVDHPSLVEALRRKQSC